MWQTHWHCLTTKQMQQTIFFFLINATACNCTVTTHVICINNHVHYVLHSHKIVLSMKILNKHGAACLQPWCIWVHIWHSHTSWSSKIQTKNAKMLHLDDDKQKVIAQFLYFWLYFVICAPTNHHSALLSQQKSFKMQVSIIYVLLCSYINKMTLKQWNFVLSLLLFLWI